MDLQSLIKDQITEAVLDKIATSAGVKQSDADKVISDGLPAILEGLKKNTTGDKGAEELAQTLSKNHNGSILSDLLSGVQDGDTANDGLKILGHIFGGKSADVEQEVSKSTGVDQASTVKILSVLAPIIMGQLGKTKQDKGLDAGGLGDLLKSQSLDGSLLGSLSKLLDRDGDGSVIDDLLGTFTKK